METQKTREPFRNRNRGRLSSSRSGPEGKRQAKRDGVVSFAEGARTDEHPVLTTPGVDSRSGRSGGEVALA